MELRRLGTSGIQVSALSLGAMTFGDSQTFMKGVTSSDGEARRVFDRAIDAGINLVDTADIYGDGTSEVLTGKWIAGKRDRVLLATKCRFPLSSLGKNGPYDQGLNRKHVIEACEASLRRLETDVIDLYQVHMQDGTVRIEETLRALDDLVRAGKIRWIGCSNYTGYRLVESLWASDKRGLARYEAVQLQWSLAVRDAEREVVPACRAFELGVLVWSPLAAGFLSGKYRRGQPPPPGSRLAAWQDALRRNDNERLWGILDALGRIAEHRRPSVAAIALAWLLAKKEVSSIIVGARTVAQLDDNLRALEVKLSPEEVRELDESSKIEWGYPQNFIAMREPW